jgi:hypothetical protein
MDEILNLHVKFSGRLDGVGEKRINPYKDIAFMDYLPHLPHAALSLIAVHKVHKVSPLYSLRYILYTAGIDQESEPLKQRGRALHLLRCSGRET